MKPDLQSCLFAVLAVLPPTVFPKERNAWNERKAFACSGNIPQR